MGIYSGDAGREVTDRSLGEQPPLPTCTHNICITCSDYAATARVVELLPDGMARVEADGSIEEISVALVEASVNDLVLVHAGVAISITGHASSFGTQEGIDGEKSGRGPGRTCPLD